MDAPSRPRHPSTSCLALSLLSLHIPLNRKPGPHLQSRLPATAVCMVVHEHRYCLVSVAYSPAEGTSPVGSYACSFSGKDKNKFFLWSCLTDASPSPPSP